MKRVGDKGRFFKIMGLEPIDRDDIYIRTKTIKEAKQQKKARRRLEHKLTNLVKEAYRLLPGKGHKPTKGEKLTKQIDKGFNVARKWMQDDK